MKNKLHKGLLIGTPISLILWAIILFLLFGCATTPRMPIALCAQKALYSAVVAERSYRTRIAWGNNDKHVQAQVQIGGKWHWLVTKSGKVYVGAKDWRFRVERYMPTEQYLRIYPYWLHKDE